MPVRRIESACGSPAPPLCARRRPPPERRPLSTRRDALFAAKLGALVSGRWGADERRASSFPGGAALVDQRSAWVLVEESPERALGKALVWADHAGAEALHLLAPTGTDVLARRASAFAFPVTVWEAHDRELREAVPATPPVPPTLDPRVAAYADALREAGAEPVVEGETLIGEVLGLEVARVVMDDGVARIEIGVGKHDRQAQQLLHGDVPAERALAGAVAAVLEHRHADAPPHPLNRLAPERWLRARLVGEPALIDAYELRPAPSPWRVDDLRLQAPAVATGTDGDGRPLVVVCSTGIDLDVVPVAVDARLADGRGARLLIVVPARDDNPIQRKLAAALVEPARVVTVPDGWRRLRP